MMTGHTGTYCYMAPEVSIEALDADGMCVSCESLCTCWCICPPSGNAAVAVDNISDTFRLSRAAGVLTTSPATSSHTGWLSTLCARVAALSTGCAGKCAKRSLNASMSRKQKRCGHFSATYPVGC